MRSLGNAVGDRKDPNSSSINKVHSDKHVHITPRPLHDTFSSWPAGTVFADQLIRGLC